MNWNDDLTRFGFACCCLAITALVFSAAQAAEPVSIESLLKEMTDRDSVARLPETDFRLMQHSSYSRESKTPDEPKGWFMNHDFNKSPQDKNFIRTEENQGQGEWVLMDHEGPGALVRTWMPWRRQQGSTSDIRIRIYLDGATEPVLEGNMLGIFDGTGLIPYPLAHPSLRSAVSFFPIPYASSCKVTTTKQPFFFQFTFREYPEGTPVKTFTMADFYEHPFHAQPRCHNYNKLNRKTNSRERNTQGYSTETRIRALDSMPFGSSLQLDMEVWSWTDCDMGYGVGTYWYGDAATTSNGKRDPVEVRNVPPLPKQGSSAAARSAASRFDDAFECERYQDFTTQKRQA